MNLNEIIALHERGLSVFPVDNQTKTPLVRWSQYQETLPSRADVEQWFSVNNRSVGVAMGPVSGLLLIDFDFTKHPEAREFLKKHKWPRTWTERTKSGGWHFYFKWVPTLDTKKTNTTGHLWAGVDTKGQGGYSKMTPSDGYRWLRSPRRTPLAEPPVWLIDLLPAKEARVIGQNSGWLKELVEKGISEGSRNVDFTRMAGSLRARGYDPDEIFFFLAGQAASVGISPDELRTICNSVGRYSIRPSGEAAARLADFLMVSTPVDWLCKPFFTRGTIGFVAGLPKTMKTWLMMDFALQCARGGGNWIGKFPVSNARVMFIDQERTKSETQRRFAALVKGYNLDPEKIDLHIRCDRSLRIDDPVSFDMLKKELKSIQPDVFIVDSFATFHAANENSRMEIQQVFERLKEIRQEFNCAIIFIDHETKEAFQDKNENILPSALRMVGSVGKVAAAECVLTVRRQDQFSSFVYHTASTLADPAGPFLVRVRDVTPDRSAVVVEAI